MVADQVADMTEQFDTCLRELRAARHEIEEYATYCARSGLSVDGPVVARLADDAQHAGLRIGRQRRELLDVSTADAAEMLSASEAVLRFGLATLAYVRNALEWCASSYGQSGAVQFFDTQTQDSPDMNYDRNGTQKSVKRVERQLLEVLDYPPDRYGLSITSSGMAAFTVIESFLVRDRLRPGDTVLLAPYTYYEAMEQLTALPFVRVEQAAGYGVEDIIAEVVRHRPRCLFADQVANTARQRMVDLPELFRRLREVVTERTTVVVDGTMLAAALPADLLVSDDKLEILYYESCTKYMQLGMDASMAGLMVYPIELFERFDTLRRNSGAVLFRHNAELFPRYDRALLRGRMQRICGNAERLATLLQGDARVRSVAEVYHPGLPNHPDIEIARSLPYASGVVTFLLHEEERNNKDELNAMLDALLANAQELGVQITKGVSFGYAVPRVWVQDITDDEPWFVRLYAGDRGHQIELLAEATSRALVWAARSAPAA
jgi:cystathionine gamma-synthase